MKSSPYYLSNNQLSGHNLVTEQHIHTCCTVACIRSFNAQCRAKNDCFKANIKNLQLLTGCQKMQNCPI